MMDFYKIERLEEVILSLEAENKMLIRLNNTLEEVAQLTRKLLNHSYYRELDELLGEKDHQRLRMLLSALGYEPKH